MLGAVAIVFVVSSVLYEQVETFTIDDSHFDRIGERLAVDAQVLNATAHDQRPILATMLSNHELSVFWPGTAPTNWLDASHGSLRELHERFAGASDLLAGNALELSIVPRAPTDVRGLLRLHDGTLVQFTAPGLLLRHHVTQGLASAAIAALAVLLVAGMLVHTLSMPLRALADVADTVGEGDWTPLDERGPREVRRLASAINAMQVRIQRLISDRTEALAAVSHDLRTPLARLRLRCGFLDDPEVQQAIEADVVEMETMVGGVLAYLAGENDPERPKAVNLAAMLITLVDEATDRGAVADYSGAEHILVWVRPLAMKRVFGNLIDNALAYGGSAHVRTSMDGTEVVVTVSDDGPGIPEGDLDRVLTPFFRLEGSRSRETGGMGLGLAIVQREVARAGGALTLSNRAGGGLEARVTLDAAQRRDDATARAAERPV
nr:ATP-binding protein [Ameyamaea chiangmaiensis]